MRKLLKSAANILLNLVFWGLFTPSALAISGGGGTIGQLDQFTSTTTPISSITQNTYGKAIKITGLSDGCLSLTTSLLTSSGSACVSGGGSWATTSTDTRFIQPAGGQGIVVNLSTSTSATSTNLYTSGQTVLAGASGNVGIGTSSPVAPLSIQSSSGQLMFFAGAGGVTPSLTVNTIGGKNAVLQAGTNGSGFIFDQTGFFQIGKDTNANIVSGNSSGGTGLFRVSATGGLSLGNSYLATDPGAGSMILSGNLGVGTTSPMATLSVGISSTTPAFAIMAAGSSTPSLFVGSANSNGYVGIGTAAPLAPLHVIDSPTTSNNGLVIQRSGNTAQFLSLGTSAGANSGTIRGNSSSGNQKTLTFLNSVSGGAATAGSADMIFYIGQLGSESETLRLQAATGNVGVGTTSPYAKLSVGMASTTPSLAVFAAGSSTPAFYVSSANGNGKVGINTTPLAVLDVQDDLTSSSLSGIVLRRNSSQYISINQAAGAIHYIQAFGSKPFVFTNQDNTVNGVSYQFNGAGSSAQNNGTPFLVMLNNGRTGIGSTTPWATLSVNPNGVAGPEFAIGSSTKTDFIVTNGGNTGVGMVAPGSKLAVNGNLAVGSTYSSSAAPTNGAIFEGNVAIGSASALGGAPLTVRGFGDIGGGTYIQQHNSTLAGQISYINLDDTQSCSTVCYGANFVALASLTYDFLGFGTSFLTSLVSGTLTVGNTTVQTSLTLNAAAASRNVILATNSQGKVIGTTTPYVNNLIGTSTTANSGFGTTSPWAQLSVSKISSDADPFFTVASTTGGTSQAVFTIDQYGHLVISAGKTPTIACTPSGGSVAGDDVHGTITTGTLSTSCTVTFANAYSATPYFVGLTTNSGTITVGATSLSATGFTVTLSAALTGSIYYLLAQ